ncbi:MAG: methyltransferase domain-containing protein [Pirellulales bacterium]|nr:methyltransferase domain-containing protein [Pirellulales bacterium]
MKRRLSETWLFLREFRRNFHTTGAILPSGRRLSAALARHVGRRGVPERVLEVGPGTGAVTRHIVPALGPDDRLDLVELNASFAQRLREDFENDPLLQPAAGRVRVIESPIQELNQDTRYNVIISGLPLNNFSAEMVEQILDALQGLAAPGGILSFFEYIAIRRARAMVSGPTERRRLRGIGLALDRVLDGREFARDAIWPNVPPAWVHHVRFDEP